MPIVFVHGVNTRSGPAYDASKRVISAYLRDSFTGARVNGKTMGGIKEPVFPYWGDLATTFAWNMASLPRGEMQALSIAGDTRLRAILATVRDAVPGTSPEPLLALARRNFVQAVEVISTLALEDAVQHAEDDTAAFVIGAQNYAQANPNPPWLVNVTNDLQLLANLQAAVKTSTGLQAQGLDSIINALTATATKLKAAAAGMVGTAVDKAGDFASTKLLAWSREELNAQLGRFFGDVFIYFNGRGTPASPGPILDLVQNGIDAAIAAAPPGEPLVIVGHSLGGVITFDLLGHFRQDLEVDLLVTVGSQVAHFEELKLYRASDPKVVGPNKATTPGNIKHWINVYDEVDIFSYAAKEVFDRVDVDARYDTQTYVIKAHGAYLDQARFYQRVRARVDKLP